MNMLDFWVDIQLEVIWGLWSEIQSARKNGDPEWREMLSELAKTAEGLHAHVTRTPNSAAQGTRAHRTSHPGQLRADPEPDLSQRLASSEAGRRERSRN